MPSEVRRGSRNFQRVGVSLTLSKKIPPPNFFFSPQLKKGNTKKPKQTKQNKTNTKQNQKKTNLKFSNSYFRGGEGGIKPMLRSQSERTPYSIASYDT
jgi:hypothetical protein